MPPLAVVRCYVEHLGGQPTEICRHACALGLEGIVSSHGMPATSRASRTPLSRSVTHSTCGPDLARERRRPAAFIVPCASTLRETVPSGPQWIHEIKHDGFRIMARKEGDPSIMVPQWAGLVGRT
jgi:ATP-dependent DNA ligase